MDQLKTNGFTGTTFHAIDAKGRLILPENIRKALGDGFVLSLSSDLKTVAFYPAEYWKNKYEQLCAMNDLDPRVIELRRRIFGSTYTDLVPDSQGRVLLPQAVRKKYGLSEGENAEMIGMGMCLELWNSNAYEAEQASNNAVLMEYIYKTYGVNKNDGHEQA